MAKPKALLDELTYAGPHKVLRGNLALVGLPGVVYTPSERLSLPAIAFGHGWMQPPDRYRGLLRHLASWGIVAAAPSTQRGPLPSHRMFAAELRNTLEIISSVRLGADGISVDPARLGLAGHATGAGAAVLAAAVESAPNVRAVATFAAAQTLPPADVAARKITVPGMHIAAANDLVAPTKGNAQAIVDAWGGPVQLRTAAKSTHMSITEGFHWTQPLLQGKPHRATQRLVNALFTAFFLVHLAGERKYAPLLEADVKHAPILLSRDGVAAT